MENNSINQTTNNMETMSNNQTTNNMENNSNNQTYNNKETMSNNQKTNNMETKSHNSKQFSSAHPGLISFIIDQSGSMSEAYPEGGTKANFTYLVVNRAINEMINANGDGETVKDRVFLSLIGCGTPVKEIRTDKLSDFANNPLRIESGTQKMSDGNGGLLDVAVQRPIYFEPMADGLTPLAATLDVVKQVFGSFMEKNPNSPAPVAIILSDGMPRSKDTEDSVEEANAIAKAQEIMALECADGHPLIFNCHIGSGNNKCEFPATEDELPDEQAKFLFKISSEVPDSYRDAARKLELDLPEHAKGMVSNADPTTFIKFVNFGSSAANQDKMSN